MFEKYLSGIKNAIIFSPHLDDSVLSMGGLIQYLLENGKHISVVNVFTKGSDIDSPLTQRLLHQAQFTNTDAYFEERKKEDEKALHILGTIESRSLDFVDGAWRKNKDGNPLYPSSVLNVYNEADNILVTELENTFRDQFHADKETAIFAPLGRGKHIDHLLVRNVCADVFPQTIFYMEFPYSDKYQNEETFIQEKHLQEVAWTNYDKELKKKAVDAYPSQKVSVFRHGAVDLPSETYYIHS